MMKTKQDVLLLIDGVVDLLLGVLLLLFPLGVADALGLPQPGTFFYSSILGAVLFGTGIALLVERFGRQRGLTGLGLEGAIVINLTGAGALVIWLLLGRLQIPVRGQLVLWAVALAVLIVTTAEVLTKSWRRGK